MVQQQYESEVNNEYVIRGNSAILKCSIPSFVADFVYVVAWQDEAGNSFSNEGLKDGNGTYTSIKQTTLGISTISPIPKHLSWNIHSLNIIEITVVTQYFEAEVVSEYVIRGNTAVLKCTIPSFVADFVKVEAWVDSNSNEYLHTDDIGTHLHEMLQTPLIPHCSIPFFILEFDDSQILLFSCKSILRSWNPYWICYSRECCCLKMLYSFFRCRFCKSGSVDWRRRQRNYPYWGPR